MTAVRHVADDPQLQATIFLKLGAFHFRLANFSRAKEYLLKSFATIDTQPADEATALCKAYICEFMAPIARQQDGMEEALEWSQRGIEALHPFSSPAAKQEEGYLLIRQGSLLAQFGNFSEAKEVTKRGMALLPPEPSPARISGLMNLGNLYNMSGDPEAALAAYQEGVTAAQTLGDNRRLATLWLNIGHVESDRGNPEASIKNATEALERYQQIDDVVGAAHAQSNLGDDYVLSGEYELADEYLTEAITSFQEHEIHDLEVFALVNRAYAWLGRGQIDQARADAEKAHRLCTDFDVAEQRAEVLMVEARIAYLDKAYDKSLQLAREALQLANENKERGRCWRLIGNVYTAQGEFAQADEAYQASEAIFADTNRYELARTHLDWGKKYLQQAYEVFAKLNIPHYADECQNLLGQQ